MAAFTPKAFLNCRVLNIHCKRFRSKINIQKPKQPHYERARVIAVTKPVYPEALRNVRCFEASIFKKSLNPYNDIIGREIRNWFDHSKMVAIFHLNSITQDELFKVRVALHKENIQLKSYGRRIIEAAICGTKYEGVMPLFVSSYCIIFSPEQKVSHLLRVTKKVPQMILIGGILEDRIMSKNEFIEFANMPDLQTVRSELVGVLNSVAGRLINDMRAHQKVLVTALDLHTNGSAENREETENELKKENANI